VATSLTHCVSQLVLQQYESRAQTAAVHASHELLSFVEWVTHSPQVPDPEPASLVPPLHAGAGLAVGDGQSLYANPPALV
jgi:hypothetical protein